MIREMDKFSFLLQVQDLLTGVAQKMALSPEMKILGSYGDDGKLRGVALWAAKDENSVVYKVKAVNEQVEIVKELLAEATARAKQLGAKKISWYTSWTKEKPKDFEYSLCYYIYRFSNRDADDMVMMWNFQAKILPLVEEIRRRGYETKPLIEATNAQREEMKALYRQKRQDSGYLDDVLDNKAGKLPDKLNYFTVYGTQVVAFSLVTEINEKNCLLRYRMSHPDHLGAMLPAFYETLNGFVNSGYDKIRLNVKEDNYDTLKMMRKHMRQVKPVMYMLEYEGEI